VGEGGFQSQGKGKTVCDEADVSRKKDWLTTRPFLEQHLKGGLWMRSGGGVCLSEKGVSEGTSKGKSESPWRGKEQGKFLVKEKEPAAQRRTSTFCRSLPAETLDLGRPGGARTTREEACQHSKKGGGATLCRINYMVAFKGKTGFRLGEGATSGLSRWRMKEGGERSVKESDQC